MVVLEFQHQCHIRKSEFAGPALQRQRFLHCQYRTDSSRLFDKHSANFVSITNQGVISALNSTEGLPIIKILQYESPLLLHSSLISHEWLNKISLAKDILENDIKLPIKEINLLMMAREVHFITVDGAAIWIDLTQDITSQLKKLSLAEGKIKLYSKKFEHIDLRIPMQIFWKWQ